MTPSELIDKQIAELTDWRGKIFVKLRKLILEADPTIKEEWKWDTAVWSCQGLICAVGAFKDHLKINFFHGASFKDSHKLFNSELEAKKTRAIDFYEGDTIDESALQDLVHEAVSFNSAKK